jgi:hypothetical protein
LLYILFPPKSPLQYSLTFLFSFLPFPFPNMAGALTPLATRPSGGSQGII